MSDVVARLSPVWWDDSYMIARLDGLFFVNFNCYKRKLTEAERDAAIGRWLLSQVEDYDGHACFPDVPYMCPDLRESVEEAMKEQQP